MAASTESGLDRAHVFHQLDSYPWDDDEEFQGGLKAILGSVSDPAQVSHLTLRAKCYYYARKSGSQVDFDGYKRWVEGHKDDDIRVNGSESITADVLESQTATTQSAPSSGISEAPKPASFAEICDMIANGTPIPGIKDIPTTILEGQSSESQTNTRKKPWEKDAGSAAQPSWMK
ncbi:Hypothetical protein R9X50_00714400 [Acrodontium crateriforme]|uniref:Uncharacterized protein n=1 Tax=Acrodontium crateriforme TaxID=150365 RepID=A0AAQ3MAI3_9PEZI|nr:Hypothetical protein R9X50_00714400 [Acrodontium crateriforme]